MEEGNNSNNDNSISTSGDSVSESDSGDDVPIEQFEDKQQVLEQKSKGLAQMIRRESTHNADVDTSLVKEHWKALTKGNQQCKVVYEMFFYILETYPHMRPIWAFGKGVNTNDANWMKKLENNSQFRHHCANVQGALTLVANNVDNMRTLTKTLEDVGSHHFFYDAYEPHLEVIQEALFCAMRQSTEEFHPRLEDAWNAVFDVAKECISSGIQQQRAKYLAQCVTKEEMQQIRHMWKQVIDHGMEDAGLNLCGGALQAYAELIKQYDLDQVIPLDIDQTGDDFKDFATDTIMALNATIDSYEENGVQGFGNVPNRIKDYVDKYVIIDVCPTLVRKAFMEGLTNMLTYVLGEMNMSEQTHQTWSKIYRVLEQAIVANIVKF